MALATFAKLLVKLLVTVHLGGRHEGITVGDVLAFFTGTVHLPPLGFEAGCTLNFNDEGHYPTASTCGLILTLPTKWPDLQSFAAKFIYGVQNHGGFGLD